MNHIRRGGTPESDAIASSEDERPWPSSTSFGSLPRKENGVHGFPGGIWSMQRRSSSFKLSEAAQRNAAREARLGAPNPHSSLKTANTPSPAASEGTGSLPFAIPLHPSTKQHRSMSHSHGQREAPQNAMGQAPGPAAALPPGLLANLEEEIDDSDSESDLGGQLTHTVSQPPIGALQRASTYSAAYAGFPPTNGRDDLHSAFASLTMDPPTKRSQWETNLGWAGVSSVNESRRHSLADIPTRRGSFADDDDDGYPRQQRSFLRDRIASQSLQAGPFQVDDGARGLQESLATMRYNEDPEGNGFQIPAMYKVPYVEIKPEERTEDDIRRERQTSQQFGPAFAEPRPRKLLYIVSFKCSRVEVFFLLENTGLHIREGDIVIVEADRGQDLGTVQHANVTPDQARLYKRKYAEEQYKWLMMFSRNNQPSNVNPNAQLYGESSASGASRGLLANAPSTMQGMPRENFNNLKPKAIKRLANTHEIKMLAEKEGNEAKAKRTCQQKVAHLHLQMEILDAEWQWDFQKLIFYYYADHYINFKDLITELYRIYKTRIWLSAVNPASFSQHAMGQPPSGIGPGAITAYGGNGLNDTYTMAYGPDPDPYGAVPPYRVGYETYDPNYPSIPGVANSFAPGTNGNTFTPTAAAFQPVTDANNPMPTVAPGNNQTGAPHDYHYYYDRTGNGEHKNIRPVSQLDTTAGSSMSPTPLVTPQQQHANPYMGHMGGYYGQSMFAPGSGFQLPAMPPPSGTPFSPWNSNRAPINPAAAGFGRQAELPDPIGIGRPMSNGNSSSTPTSARQENHPPFVPGAGDYARQYGGNPGAGANEDRMRALNLGRGFDRFSGPPPAASGNGLGNTAAPPSAAENNGNVNKWAGAQQQDPGQTGGYAEEMSRER